MSLAKLFHFVAVAHFGYGLYYWNSFWPEEVKYRKYEFGGNFIYLTYWNFCIQAIYFATALINDFFGSNEILLIRKIRDFIYGAFLFPFAFLVSGLFWGLYVIDKELIFPAQMRVYFPWWLNQFVHTNVSIFCLLETVIVYHKYPPRKLALAAASVVCFAYIIWIYVIKFVAGAWVYQVLNVLNGFERIGLYTLGVVAVYGLYFIGEFVNKRVWNKTKTE